MNVLTHIQLQYLLEVVYVKLGITITLKYYQKVCARLVTLIVKPVPIHFYAKPVFTQIQSNHQPKAATVSLVITKTSLETVNHVTKTVFLAVLLKSVQNVTIKTVFLVKINVNVSLAFTTLHLPVNSNVPHVPATVQLVKILKNAQLVSLKT
jgi:hypothetical protein